MNTGRLNLTKRYRGNMAKRDTELEAFERRAQDSPEHVLMRAVMEDAIKCYRKPKRPTEHRLAEEWIFAPDECYLFSFEHICEELGFNPQTARRVLRGRQRETT